MSRPTTVDGVKLRERTVRAALDADVDSTGFALARFTIGPDDLAYNPASSTGMMLPGPARLTYERRPDGTVRVRSA